MAFKRILLVKPPGRHGLSYAFDIIPTGLEYIAASIEDIVDDINIIDLEMDQKPADRTLERYLNELKPDLVGISMSSTEHKEGLDIAKAAYAHGIKVVMGGFHPTAIYAELLTHKEVTFVVRGEGEHTMRELVSKGSAEDVLGVSYRKGKEVVNNPDRPVIPDLDSIPLPARHLRRYHYLLALAKGREYDVITTSRGCWGKCSFCCEPSISHSRMRFRKAEKVIEEIEKIYALHDKKPLCIEITDPHFMGKPRLVEQICDLLAKRDMDIEYIAKVRPDTMAKFPKIVKKMVQVGIDSYEMGIESPSTKDLDYTSKGIKSEVHIRAAQNIKKWGGSPGGTFVIGLPDHTEEEILTFPAYGKKIGLLSSAFGIVTPYPGTKFYEQMDEQGLIFETSWNRFDEMHSVFKVKHLTKERLEELATICMAKFWTLDTFLEKERVRLIRKPQKRSLPFWVYERLQDFQWSAGSGTQLQGANFDNHVVRMVEALPEPEVEAYTRKVGVHNILEMSTFLKILGEQSIQITVRNEGKVLASWVMKTKPDAVEYIASIPGKQKGCTIDFEADLKDLKQNGNASTDVFDGVRIALKLLASNKGLKRRLNLFKLFVASGAEILRYFKYKNNGGNGNGHAKKLNDRSKDN